MTEGDGDRHAVGTRAYKGIAVQVTDGTGAPVTNARVTFQLPEEGPTGKFANGLNREVTATDPQGRAAVWGISWNGIPGECRVSIFAARGSARAGTTAAVTLTGTATSPAAGAGAAASFEVAQPPPAKPTKAAAKPAPAPNSAPAVPPTPKKEAVEPAAPAAAPPSRFPSRDSKAVLAGAAAGTSMRRPGVVLSPTERLEEPLPGSWRKWLWIGLAAGGAVGGGLFYKMSRPASAAATTQATPAAINPVVTRPAIGNPVITIGRP